MSPGLLLAALLAAQTGPTPRAVPATPAPPAAETQFYGHDWPPRSRFSDDDYPAAAIRGDQEGVVGFHIDIGADGRVSNCTIRRSSGSAALDQATCRILRVRTRFVPARDSEGNAVPDARDGEITWRLPDDEDD